MTYGYRLNDDEKLLLEAVFTYNKYPNSATLQDLAKKLAVNERKVRNWFVAKRIKLKHKANQNGQIPRKYIILYFFSMYMYSIFRHIG